MRARTKTNPSINHGIVSEKEEAIFESGEVNWRKSLRIIINPVYFLRGKIRTVHTFDSARRKGKVRMDRNGKGLSDHHLYRTNERAKFSRANMLGLLLLSNLIVVQTWNYHIFAFKHTRSDHLACLVISSAEEGFLILYFWLLLFSFSLSLIHKAS